MPITHVLRTSVAGVCVFPYSGRSDNPSDEDVRPLWREWCQDEENVGKSVCRWEKKEEAGREERKGEEDDEK